MWDHFYGSLNPKYQQIMAHSIDGEQPAVYSDLLLAVQRLERLAEARDLLLPKTTTTGVSNITLSQTPGNFFPSQGLEAVMPLQLSMLQWKAVKWKKTPA